jgi:sugar (pentulose or hexulose) kinase/phosphoglycerate dehydrogenase-like enzyme/ribulose-5-phosphate 4-epimerase/fuculose-1-phosphate aldolase/putative sterol carrier protein
MSRRLLLGIDLGGGSVRCVVLDADTGACTTSALAFASDPAEGTGGLGYDVDTDALWDSVAAASRAALERAGAAADEVAGVAVTAMRFASVLLDDAGEVLLAVPNRDARSAGESHRIASERGEAVLAATGMWPLPIHAAPRLAWLRGARPDLFARAAVLLSLSDWLNFRLCGSRVTDPSQAGCTGVFDLRRGAWSDELIGAFDLPRALFPELRACGERIGALSAQAAQQLGLAPGTSVVLGGGDTRCGLLGAGAIADGDVGLVAGTTAPLELVLAEPLVDPEGRLRSGHHVVPGRYVLEANAGPIGEGLAWLARLLYPDDARPEQRLLAEASTAPIGSAAMLANVGALVANDRRSAFPVASFSLSHMTGTHGHSSRASLARSALEGMACAVRANLEQLARVSGRETRRIHLAGGLSRSALFARILAGVSGVEVVRAAAPETSGLGAALCAGIGAGVFANAEEAVRRGVRAGEICAPVAAESPAYAQLHQGWSDLHAAGETTTAPIAMRHTFPAAIAAAQRTGRRRAAAHRPDVLVTAAFDDASIAKLRSFAEVEYASFRERMQLLTGPSLVKALANREVLITEVDVVDAKALEQLPKLRVVAACRGDAVNVDIAACTAFGIPVLYAPGRNADAVADLTVAFLLNLARRLPAATAFLADPAVTAGNLAAMGKAFRALQGSELGSKTVGLVGLGAVGRAVARRLSGFGVRLLVADPFVTAEEAVLAGAHQVELDELLRESDFVSLHAAVTDATRGLIGAQQLAAMKPGAYLINTARAALLDEVALLAALDSGHLAGAALDTFAVEPPGADHPLVRHAQVIHTPHVGGNTHEVAAHQGRIIAAALEQLVRGESPRCLRNPETLAGFSWTGPRRVPSADELAALGKKAGPAVSDLQRDAQAEAKAEKLDASVAPAEIVAKMKTLLETFTSEMANDARVREFSADQDVALYFVLPDVGLDLHIALREGQVTAALGKPEGGSVVQLRMRAAILDGMFTGKVNAMEAAMQGEVAFTGDAGKAMAIQQMQGDMRRVYTAARQTVGDPGDLASIPQPGGAAPAREAAAAKPVAANDVRIDIVATTKELYENQVITATGGNVCARIPGSPDQVWITPSQLFKGDLRPEVLVRIDLDGKSLDEGARSPSSEWSMHTQILKKKPEAKAVIHAHAPFATTLANAGLPFLPISTEAAFFGDIPRVPFIMPGTDALAEAVSDAMKESWAVLMINHGLVVCGRSLRRAADMVEIVERSAQLILGCYAVGKEPPVLPEKTVAMLRKMGDLVA